MATAYGPSIVRDGLVLNLDAANPKSLLTSVEVLVVAGGGAGGGGNYNGGGGGAGGLIYNSAFLVTAGTSYTVTVGAGGTGAATKGANGSNSVFGSLTAIGGGGGGAHPGTLADQTGGTGGSGGGGSQGGGPGGAGTAGQGNAGGGLIYAAGAGGGGAGAAVTTSGMTGAPYSYGVAPVSGGIGLQYAISGTPTYYAGGGGGGGRSPYSVPQGIGGTGGGGNGAVTTGGTGFSGVSNTGGGGGGNYAGEPGTANAGGSGGSGIVIVRYFGTARATGGTITSVGGYTIHTFTTVGSTTFTPNATWSDLSGGNNNATLVNNPTYTNNERGYLTFLGTQAASFSAPALSSSNTLEFVFYNTSGTDTYPTLYSQVGQNGASGFHWVYGFPSSETINVQYANGTSPVSMSYSSALPLNTYVHISIVSDLSAQSITCYRNGVSLGTTSTPGIKPIAASTGYIGTYQNDTSSSSYRLKGRVPYFKIYNIALTAAQVAQNFNALRGRYGI